MNMKLGRKYIPQQAPSSDELFAQKCGTQHRLPALMQEKNLGWHKELNLRLFKQYWEPF
jgi:hypothetical protein